jgi:hypothetical protein
MLRKGGTARTGAKTDDLASAMGVVVHATARADGLLGHPRAMADRHRRLDCHGGAPDAGTSGGSRMIYVIVAGPG